MIVDITNKIIIKDNNNIPKINIPFTKNNFINSSKKNPNISSSRFKLVNENKKSLTIYGTKINSGFINHSYIEKSKKIKVNKQGNIKKKKTIKIFENQNTKKFQISYFHYLFPLSSLFKKYDNLNHYANLLYKYMSIETIIPLIERLSKMNSNQKNKDKTNYFKLNSTIFKVSSNK